VLLTLMQIAESKNRAEASDTLRRDIVRLFTAAQEANETLTGELHAAQAENRWLSDFRDTRLAELDEKYLALMASRDALAQDAARLTELREALAGGATVSPVDGQVFNLTVFNFTAITEPDSHIADTILRWHRSKAADAALSTTTEGRNDA